MKQQSIQARIESVSVRYGGALRTADYESRRVEMEITASPGTDQSYEELIAELWALVKASTREQGLEIRKEQNGNGTHAEEPPPPDPQDYRPRTLGELVTPKQLWMTRNLGREIGVDVEQECASLMACNLEEISKRAASSFIDQLKKRHDEMPPAETPPLNDTGGDNDAPF